MAVTYEDVHAASLLRSHIHPEAMEICYIITGAVTWFAEDQEHDLHGGQVFCTWPGEAHGGIDGIWHPSRLYWLVLHLPDRFPRGFLGLPDDEGRALHTALWNFSRRAFHGPRDVGDRFAELLRLEHYPSPLQSLSARAALVRLLVRVCELSRAADAQRLPEAVRNALGMMRDNFETPLSVHEIARRVGLSPAHFHRVFKAETGLSPGDYYIRTRANAARRLLRDTQLSVLEIALRCGFGSSQYLATCLKRVTGRSPSEYRASQSE